FVHGFLGSDESFEEFPQHLVARLAQDGVLPPDQVEIKIFPRFDTKGNNALAAKRLADWLLLHATTVNYRTVILLAHSMGGLLCADAYALLYRMHIKPPEKSRSVPSASPPEPDNSGWFARSTMVLGAVRSFLTRPEPKPASAAKDASDTTQRQLGDDIDGDGADDEEYDDGEDVADEDIVASEEIVVDARSIRALVNVGAIITFDSPFYGLASNVITTAGKNKVLGLVADAASTLTSFAAVAAAAGAPATAPADTPPNAAPVPSDDTESALVLRASDAAAPLADVTAAASAPPSWSAVAKYTALGGAAAAVALYALPAVPAAVPAGAMLAARSYAASWAAARAEDVRGHAEFLYPLVNSRTNMHSRVDRLLAEMRDGVTRFHAFFLEIPDPSIAAIQPGAAPPPDPDMIARAPAPTTFCVPPPSSKLAALETAFTRVAAPSHLNVIDAHMHLFNPDRLLDHYPRLVRLAADQVRESLACAPAARPSTRQ
ncbi:hypothetical protein HK405_013561, partial [Cladochytrium tenue]